MRKCTVYANFEIVLYLIFICSSNQFETLDNLKMLDTDCLLLYNFGTCLQLENLYATMITDTSVRFNFFVL